MSIDHYIMSVRMPTKEELEFANKRFVHDSNLFVIDNNDEQTRNTFLNANLCCPCEMYYQETDTELLKKDHNIPQETRCTRLAIRPDHVELVYTDTNKKDYTCIISEWDWEHHYTIIGKSTSYVTHAEELYSWNNEPKLTKIVKKYFNPREINYGIMPKKLIDELQEKEWIYEDYNKNKIYVYHEWY